MRNPHAIRRRRRNERGAIVFVVAMTLAVLASLGLFALIAASGEVKTAGHERQNLQSHYLAETGVVATTQLLATKGDVILSQMWPILSGTQVGDFDSSKPRNQCWSLSAVSGVGLLTPDVHARECKILLYRPKNPTPPSGYDLVQGFYTAGGYNQNGITGFNPTDGTAVALSPAQLNGVIRVEVTDAVAGSTLKTNATGGQAQQNVVSCTVTVTTYGETLPAAGTSYGGAGLEVGRARITFLSLGKNCK